MEVFRNLGGVITILIAMISQERWRFFVVAPVSIMFITFLLIAFMLPESSRYLLFKDKKEEVIRLLNVMSNENKCDFKVLGCTNENDIFGDNQRSISICNDLIIKKWRTTVPMLMIWFFPAFGMGIFYFLPDIMLQLNFTLNDAYAISSYLLILPMLGVVMTTFLIDSLGRRNLITLSTFIA
mmetsp:Transcript_39360/g.45192  ORF Transcript_39360/g.45192 Transcript_39360/m.45192 type:complete len:182 (+) Transcript_39360:538-1083(+)